MTKTKEKASLTHKILTIVGIVLCVILIPALIINCTLIIKSYINPDQVPTVGGYCPLIVLTDSMYPQIHSGDLIICKTIDPETVEEGDVIAFFDPAGNGSTIVTHQVIEVVMADEEGLMFRTQGTANNAPDKKLVPAENVVGEYQFRIAGAGHVALFMQKPEGLIVCVVVPLLLLIGYDVLRRKLYEKSKKADTDALLAELEALKAEKAKAEEEKAEQLTADS